MQNEEVELVENEYFEMWNNWLIYQKFEATSDLIQIKKQIGVVAERLDFQTRPSLIHQPGL